MRIENVGAVTTVRGGWQLHADEQTLDRSSTRRGPFKSGFCLNQKTSLMLIRWKLQRWEEEAAWCHLNSIPNLLSYGNLLLKHFNRWQSCNHWGAKQWNVGESVDELMTESSSPEFYDPVILFTSSMSPCIIRSKLWWTKEHIPSLSPSNLGRVVSNPEQHRGTAFIVNPAWGHFFIKYLHRS